MSLKTPTKLMSEAKVLTILGAGNWGSTLAVLAQRNHHQVHLWSRHGSSTLAELTHGADVVLSAVSMKGVRETAEKLVTTNLSPQTIIVTATKGLEPNTSKTPAQIWQDFFPQHRVVVLSGPNLSKEINRNLPAATVVASTSMEAAQEIQTIFASESFRVYANSDPLGTELGGTLKNVTAIAAGVCDGLQLGTNAKAALLTRALPEMIRVGSILGAQKETFFGLSGLGDLLATCNSPLSRNYQVGYQLAQNKPLEEILAAIEGTAEGVNTTNVLVEFANQHQIAVPIAHQVHLLLQGKVTPQQAVQALMARTIKSEFGDLF